METIPVEMRSNGSSEETERVKKKQASCLQLATTPTTTISVFQQQQTAQVRMYFIR